MLHFFEMGLRPEVIAAIEALGFETPTEIQCQAIPYLLQQRRDLIALAQTGTGKTAAFGLPIVNEIRRGGGEIEALIISPTRELALQITEDLKHFSRFLDLKIQPVYGGADINRQIKGVRKAHIAVGTPGRIGDLIKRKKLHIDSLKYLVLDEADEMLTMGFKVDLDFICSHTPREKQTLLFSATMSKAIFSMTKGYMRKPHQIEIGNRNQGAKTVSHHYYLTAARQRYNALKQIVDSKPSIYSIVFCRTRLDAKETADKLIRDGYRAAALHGDMSQAQRNLVMGHFRGGHLRLLVATDVAARGVDVSKLTHVINYNLPDDGEAYVHRSGRTGRAGKKGISILLITPKELRKLRSIQKTVGKTFIQQKLPDGKKILQAQAIGWTKRLSDIAMSADHGERIRAVMPQVEERLECLTKAELIERMLFVQLHNFLKQ
ncbi:MAG: DEAD/DEAH box helicase [Flavobacteriales bacterium]